MDEEIKNDSNMKNVQEMDLPLSVLLKCEGHKECPRIPGPLSKMMMMMMMMMMMVVMMMMMMMMMITNNNNNNNNKNEDYNN